MEPKVCLILHFYSNRKVWRVEFIYRFISFHFMFCFILRFCCIPITGLNIVDQRRAANTPHIAGLAKLAQYHWTTSRSPAHTCFSCSSLAQTFPTKFNIFKKTSEASWSKLEAIRVVWGQSLLANKAKESLARLASAGLVGASHNVLSRWSSGLDKFHVGKPEHFYQDKLWSRRV